jgi:hemerythrin-like metal-binding protein
MPEIQWSDEFSVGVQTLDDQHKAIIAMVNSMQRKLDTSIMFDTVMQMFAYASEHFAVEEKLMRSRDYQELPEQLAEHKEFLEKVTEFSSWNFDSPVAHAEVASYLRDWWNHHILDVDMKYKNRL